MNPPADIAIQLSSEDKRALLERVLAERIGRRQSTRHPLSHGQRAMWFLHKLAPESTAYNLGEAIAIRGSLDVERLRRALGKLMRRHAMLRTTTTMNDDDEPEQIVHADVEIPLGEHEAGGWSDKRLRRELSAEIDRPFDLEAEPPFRMGLYTRAPDHHVLLLTLHHIAGELWAMLILVDELWALLGAEDDDSDPGLPALTREYGDFARWQLDMLAGPEGKRHARYWKNRFADPAPSLALPTDRPRPRVKTFNGALRSFDLDRELSEQVMRFARDSGATLYATLLSAFFALLQRCSGQRDIVVGTPMTGRVEEQWAAVIGYFDNPLPLRVEIDESDTFADLLGRVRGTVVEAFEHHAMPFPLLVEHVGAERDPSRSPLFDVMFVLRRAQMAGMQTIAALGLGREPGAVDLAGGLQVQGIELDRCVAQFDLALSCAEVDGQLVAGWEYNRDLFDQTTIDRLSAHFVTLLAGLVATPDAPLSSVPILTAGERRQLTVGWNATAAETSRSAMLHDGFEAQVARDPHALAVVQGTTRLTYGALSARSDAIAAWLRANGARPNELVAVAMHKGWEQIAAVLGVLKAGAAYLPVDPALPAERFAQLLQIGEVRLVLTQPALGAALSWPGDVVRLAIDERVPVAPAAPPAPSPAVLGDLAYVIFTSGSTGVPKGVMIEHGAAANTVWDINARFGVGADDRVFALSSLSFDLSVYDVFGTLAAGAAIILPEPGAQHDPLHWLELVGRERVTIWNSVPMLLKLLLEAIDDPDEHAALAPLRVAMMSGDWIPVDLPSRLRAILPDVDVVSLGGATEASIWSILYRVGRVDPAWTSIPYGRPMANQRFYVLNEALEPCPTGVAGGLYIGGVGLARGYWRDEERTARSFITWPQTGERLYDTGDLGKLGQDGEIEFLGRADHQVKVRGVRVELGEIETILGKHTAVAAAVVIAQSVDGENRLVAYVVSEGESEAPPPQELRTYCSERLPPAMVPAVFVALDALPMSANGKVNRQALAPPIPERRPVQAPRTATERTLAGLVSTVVGGGPVGRDDGFVELGGDSVSAIRLCSEARRAGLALTPKQIFGADTVAELGALLDAEAAAASTGVAPRSVRPAAGAVATVTPLQRTMLLHATYDDAPALYCEQILVEIDGELQPELLRRACERIVGRHESLRSTFAWNGRDDFVRGVSESVAVTLEQLDLRAHPDDLQGERFDAFLAADRARGFRLDGTPLQRWTVMRLRDRRYRLVWTHHHVLIDGWSLTLVVRELAATYTALAAGHEPDLPAPLPLSAYDAWLDTRDRGAAERFWRAQLEGFESATALTLPRPAGDPESAFAHAERTICLPAGETAALAGFGRAHGLTLNTLVQGAWALLLSRYSGDDDVVYGVTASGRSPDLYGIESIVGLFINTVPMRVRVPAAAEAVAWLKDLQRLAVDVREYEWVGAEHVAACGQLPEPNKPFALYESILVFENYPADAGGLQAGGVTFGDVGFTEQTNTPLMIYALPGAELELRATFDRRRFACEDVQRLLGHLRQLLLGLAGDAHVPVASVGMLGDAERRALDTIATGAPPAPGAEHPVHEAIVARARSTPDAPALEQDGRVLTYGQLVDRAGRVARRLIELGVERERVVAIVLERAPELVVAQLAVLLAGGGFVTLDCADPDDRMTYILGDADARVIITQPSQRARVDRGDRPVVLLDEALGQDAEPAGLEAAPSTPEHLAYLLYTSGSTGRPKGVVIEHRSLAHFTAAAVGAYGLRSDDRVLQFAALSFDASIEEIYPALTCGAALVLRTDAMLDSLEAFVASCAAQRVTVLDLPTAFWHELVLGLERGLALPACLRLVIIGGERADFDRLVRWRRHAPASVRLVNTYGPTETTVVVTAADLGADTSDYVPIGRPLPGVSATVLDLHHQPTPIGVVGELVVAGPQVMRGYRNQPALTSERLTVDGAYRTGDLVRWRPGGALEFVGRADDQVKVSGYRVEPAEVAAVLRSLEGVMDAEVIARTDGCQNSRLTGYVVAEPGAQLDIAALHAALSARLPRHMVPDAHLVLDALPRTTSGKLDRRALPDMARHEAAAHAPVAPRTPAESVVAAAVASVLGLEQVDVHASFFALGGGSLQTIQLASRLSSAVGYEVKVKTVLLHPGIAELAAAIERDAAPGAGSCDEPSRGDAGAAVVSPGLTIEHRPLLSLVASGRLARVDAAALTYVPAALEHTSLPRRMIVEQWCHGMPVLCEVLELPLGRIASLMVPRFQDELYDPACGLVDVSLEALRMASFAGAGTVSLTGLLPSATDYGRALAKRAAAHGDLPAVTTGHATTVAAVALSVRSILEHTGRKMTTERLGALGLGAVGLPTLALLLDTMPHPAHIALCDVYEKREYLRRVRDDLRARGYRGEISLHESHGDVPAAFYSSTLVVGATNAPEVLDIDRLQPGTLIVDDSAPHCFSIVAARDRLAVHGDILFTEGGFVRAPAPLNRVRYWPETLDDMRTSGPTRTLFEQNERELTACMLSSLLSAKLPDLPTTTGIVSAGDAGAHLAALDRLGFGAAMLRCEELPLDLAAVAAFRERYGER